jgi:rhodanese-related sulfurtransferase
MKNISVFILLLLSLTAHSVAANEFPGRTEFPEQAVIELEELYNNRANMIIIDTRTDFEYNVIHIKDSVHVNFEADDYIDRLKEIRQKDRRKMVFYCNGLTCTKAFRAHAAAAKAGIRNTVTFDAGVFTWARTYPDEAALMGKSPVDPNRLLSREALAKRLLDANSFS